MMWQLHLHPTPCPFLGGYQVWHVGFLMDIISCAKFHLNQFSGYWSYNGLKIVIFFLDLTVSPLCLVYFCDWFLFSVILAFIP